MGLALTDDQPYCLFFFILFVDIHPPSQTDRQTDNIESCEHEYVLVERQSEQGAEKSTV